MQKESVRFSVVIAARNCVDRMAGTVNPWLSLKGCEVIVVDQMSTDGTADEARRLGCRVFENDPPQGNFDINRKVGLQEASAEWVLWVDTDERPTRELVGEIEEFLSKFERGDEMPDAVRIELRNYFLGRELKHALVDKRAAAIRIVRRGRWAYPCEEGFHRAIEVKGPIIRFNNAIRHFNYNSLGEWFLKTNQYTEVDSQMMSQKLLDNKGIAARPSLLKALFKFKKFFLKYYFWKRGYLDGAQGFLAVLYFGFYHFSLQVKTWDMCTRRQLQKEVDYIDPISVPKR